MRVLLVEDDDGDALLVDEMLMDSAADVTLLRERTIAAATGRAVDGQIDCVLLDLGLPDAHGLEAVERLRTGMRRVPIVVLTGQDDERRGIESLGAGAQEYLVKGQVDGPLLTRAMRYAIERSQAETDAQVLLEAQLQAQENVRLERGLLPTALLHDPDLRITSTYRPGRRRALLGGDFYDAVELPDGTVHALIGDVCGHGPDEAALGACLRIAWRALTLAQRPVLEVLDVMDQMLEHERYEQDIFATVCLVQIDASRTQARMYTAGHPPPVLLHAHEAPVALAPVHVHPPIGLAVTSGWTETAVELRGPWSLLLYTDGLIEGRIGPGDARLGVEGLLALLPATGRPTDPSEARQLLGRLVERVETLNGGDLTDDLAMVLLSWR